MELQAAEEKTAIEERKYQAQLEQERQDHELALRLAEESNGQLEESPPMSRKYVEKFVAIHYQNFVVFHAKKTYMSRRVSHSLKLSPVETQQYPDNVSTFSRVKTELQRHLVYISAYLC